MPNTKVDLILNYHIKYVVEEIMKQHGLNKIEVQNRFISSETYTLLCNLDSHLYLESPEYVLDMYQSELNGGVK